MSAWVLSLIFGLGAATWAYTYMARANGNADPKNNALLATVVGLIVFFFFFSLLKLVLNLP
jgi:hypothetical protein